MKSLTRLKVRLNRFLRWNRQAWSLRAKAKELVRHESGDVPLHLPRFLCIGGQKCGTSWLMKNVAQHPDIFVPENLQYFDIHYFDMHFHRPFSWYASFFEKGIGKCSGECTPAYGFMDVERIRWVHRAMPKAKILLMVRNPIDRAWSHARMNLASDQNRSVADVGEQEFLDHFHSQRSLVRSDYVSMLEKWSSVYPANQILVSFFDEIATAPRDLLARVFQFVGASVDVDWSRWELEKVVNKGQALSIPERLHQELVAIYKQPIGNMALQFGHPATDWICR